MSPAVFLVGLGLFCSASVTVAMIALRGLAKDRAICDRMQPVRLWLLCLVLAIAAAMADGALRPTRLADVGLLVLVVWATITAAMDRATTWVPDISAIMLMFGALAHDPDISGLSALPLWPNRCPAGSSACVAAAALGWAVVFWLVALLGFVVQRALGQLVLTAADIVAVALPVIAFGLSPAATVAFFLAALVIVLARRSERLHLWLAEGRALREGLDDLGQDHVPASGALPAFVIFAPITAMVAACLTIMA